MCGAERYIVACRRCGAILTLTRYRYHYCDDTAFVVPDEPNWELDDKERDDATVRGSDS